LNNFVKTRFYQSIAELKRGGPHNFCSWFGSKPATALTYICMFACCTLRNAIFIVLHKKLIEKSRETFHMIKVLYRYIFMYAVDVHFGILCILWKLRLQSKSMRRSHRHTSPTWCSTQTYTHTSPTWRKSQSNIIT
jgi:hypothetical protein